MTLAQIFVTYFASSAIILFMVLPLFKPEPPREIIPGTPASAPQNPQIGKKFLVTGILGAVFTAGVYAVLDNLVWLGIK